MNAEQQKSILAITLFAAFADGAKHDREREEVRRGRSRVGLRCWFGDGVGGSVNMGHTSLFS